MTHGNPVIDRDRVELARDAACLTDGLGDDLADRLQVGVSRDELRVGVGHRDDRLAKVLAGDAGGAQERSGTRHVAAVGDGPGA